jgi:hypothetical protein
VTRSVISFEPVGRLARRTVAHVCAMTHSIRGRLILFGTIGLSGFAPNLIILFLVTEFLEINYAVAAIGDTVRDLLELSPDRPVRIPPISFRIVVSPCWTIPFAE